MNGSEGISIPKIMGGLDTATYQLELRKVKSFVRSKCCWAGCAMTVLPAVPTLASLFNSGKT